MGVAHDLILLGASFYSINAPQSSDINSSQLWDAIGMRARMEGRINYTMCYPKKNK